MLPAKGKSGNIIIYLIFVLLFALGVFFLAQYLNSSQINISAAIDIQYQNPLITPSAKMDVSPNKWVVYNNSNYKYKIHFPKQWASANANPAIGEVDTYTRFLGSRLNLKVSVLSNYEIPSNFRPAKFGNNYFFYDDSQPELKQAAIQHDNNIYLIRLTQNSYFADDTEFTATFFHILQNFEFTD